MNKRRALRIAQGGHFLMACPVRDHEQQIFDYLNEYPKFRHMLVDLLKMETKIVIACVGEDKMLKRPEQLKVIFAPFNLTSLIEEYRVKFADYAFYQEVANIPGLEFKELEVEIHPNPMLKWRNK